MSCRGLVIRTDPGLLLPARRDGERMAEVFDIYTIIFLALAVFIFLRLRSVLGQRTGRERPPYDPYSARDAVRSPAGEKVVALDLGLIGEAQEAVRERGGNIPVPVRGVMIRELRFIVEDCGVGSLST